MKNINNKIKFSKRTSIYEIEEGKKLCPKFNKEKLLPCITVEYKTNQILMFSYINKLAFQKSLETKNAHYFSRSRQSIWLKGETSGMYHHIRNMFIDDDQDCVIFEVKLTKPKKGGKEASCHVGYKSCFYRKIQMKDGNVSLKFTEKKKSFDPNIVYKGIANPTKI